MNTQKQLVVDIKDITPRFPFHAHAVICILPQTLYVLGIQMQMGMYIEKIARTYPHIAIYTNGGALIPKNIHFTHTVYTLETDKIITEIERKKIKNIFVLMPMPNTSKKEAVKSFIEQYAAKLKTQEDGYVITVKCAI